VRHLDSLRAKAEERLGILVNEDRLRELERFAAQHAKGERPAHEPGVEDFLNGETYFFRYPFFLNLLKARVAGSVEAPFRVLCPACSTGEEVYSLSFALFDAALANGRGLEIVGSDVRPKAIRVAREGVYGVWSLRNMPPGERPLYFDVPHPGRFRVKDAFRSLVRFAVANLLDPIEDGPFDGVVLCNATLYMHERAAREVYANIRACLKPDGLLLIAPTDPPPGAAGWRHCPEYSGWSVYRPARESGAGEQAGLAATLDRAQQAAAAVLAAHAAHPAPRRAPRRAARPPAEPARKAAASRPAPEPVLSVHPPMWSLQPEDTEIWSAWATGRLASVEERLRQKVFFEPDQPLWRFLQGVVLWEQGWLKRARREIEQAERLLGGAAPETLVSGLCTAAELRRLIDEWSAQHG
jgi:chemotaxis methyl-accepting protein methylase